MKNCICIIPDFLKYVLCNFNICLADACFKLFVSTDSTSSHEFASQFGLAFFIREKHSKAIGKTVSRASVC